MSKIFKSDFVMESKYLPIADAAEIIGCKKSELLHLGSIGKIDILSSVMQVGDYIWPNKSSIILLRERRRPFVRFFHEGDRVYLPRHDIARIEGVGWASPNSFFQPEIAANYLDKFIFNSEGKKAQNSPSYNYTLVDNEVGGEYVTRDGPTFVASRIKFKITLGSTSESVKKRHELATRTPWEKEGKISSARTTVDNLFIPNSEIDRILSRGLNKKEVVCKNNGESEKINKGRERFALNREPILMAAIYCMINYPSECADDTAWATTIDQKAALFWPSGRPPLELSTIIRMLGKARKTLTDLTELDFDEACD